MSQYVSEEAKAKRQELDARKSDGEAMENQYALLKGIRKGKVGVVQDALHSGADANYGYPNSSPLLEAVKQLANARGNGERQIQAREDVIKELLRQGADPLQEVSINIASGAKERPNIVVKIPIDEAHIRGLDDVVQLFDDHIRTREKQTSEKPVVGQHTAREASRREAKPPIGPGL